MESSSHYVHDSNYSCVEETTQPEEHSMVNENGRISDGENEPIEGNVILHSQNDANDNESESKDGATFSCGDETIWTKTNRQNEQSNDATSTRDDAIKAAENIVDTKPLAKKGLPAPPACVFPRSIPYPSQVAKKDATTSSTGKDPSDISRGNSVSGPLVSSSNRSSKGLDNSDAALEGAPLPLDGLERQRAGFVHTQPGAFAVIHPDELNRRRQFSRERGGQENQILDSTLNFPSPDSNEEGDFLVTAEVLPRVSILDSTRLQMEYENRMRETAIIAEVREIPKSNKSTRSSNINVTSSSKDRRKSIILYCILFGAIALMLGLSVGLEQAIHKHSHCGELDLFVEEDIGYLQDLFCNISGKKALSDHNDPRYQAIDWLANTDAYLSEDFRNEQRIPELKERYALAVLYFSTGGPTTWDFHFGFLNPVTSVCSWPMDNDRMSYGVTCNSQGKVTSINILYNNLTGTLPPELSQLSELRYLELAVNNLYGSLPREYSNLVHLTDILLMVNSLSGTFPDSYQSLRTLQTFMVGFNAFAGSIPESYNRLTSLKAFFVAHNELTGTIPSSMMLALNQMNDFDIGSNFIEGAIPLSFSKDSVIERLRLENNMLTGSIPEGISGLSKLKIIDVSGNKLTGALSGQNVHGLSDLKILRMNNNEFSGSLPTSIGNQRSVEELNLSNNLLSGSLPTQLGNLFYLKNLDVSSNDFKGTVPSELGYLTRLTSLKIGSNPLSSTIPTNFGALTESLHYFFLENTDITGGLEEAFCNRLDENTNNSTGNALVTEIKADCLGYSPTIPCHCCTVCCDISNIEEDICEVDPVRSCEVHAAVYESYENRGAECACSDTGVQCQETCESCTLDGSSCATNKYSDVFDASTGSILEFHNSILYTTGPWEGTMLEVSAYTTDNSCTMAVNGTSCRRCSYRSCAGNSFGYDISCDNLEEGYHYSACGGASSPRTEDPGYLTILNTHQEGLYNGCILILPHLSDYQTT